jgi:hypothetical protein
MPNADTEALEASLRTYVRAALHAFRMQVIAERRARREQDFRSHGKDAVLEGVD